MLISLVFQIFRYGSTAPYIHAAGVYDSVLFSITVRYRPLPKARFPVSPATLSHVSPATLSHVFPATPSRVSTATPSHVSPATQSRVSPTTPRATPSRMSPATPSHVSPAKWVTERDRLRRWGAKLFSSFNAQCNRCDFLQDFHPDGISCFQRLVPER